MGRNRLQKDAQSEASGSTEPDASGWARAKISRLRPLNIRSV